jgi:hypothetical protein
MMDRGSRLRTRVPLLLLVAGVAAVAAIVIYFKALEHRRWSRLEERMARLRAEADARFCPRPVLRGAPISGDAWEDYVPAIDLVAKMGEYPTIQMVAVSSNEPSYDEIRDLVEKYAAAVDGMRRGTRRAEVRRIRIHERGTDPEDPWPRSASVLGELACCRARLLASEGKTREAVELQADVLKYAEDLSVDGSDIAFRLNQDLTRSAFIGVEFLLKSGGLTGEDCRVLACDLGSLDATFPRFATMLLGRLEYFGAWALRESPLDDLENVGCKPQGMVVSPGWREAYSQRLMKAAAFEQAEALYAGLRSTDGGSPSADAGWRTKIRAERDASKNTYFRLFVRPEEIPDARLFRDLRARLRLLRLAAHWRATGEFLELEDPHGTKFAHAIEPPDRMKFWGLDQSLEIPLGR